VVISTDDAGLGTFRQSLLDANAAAGPDSIHFAIPSDGPHSIQPLSALPTVTDTVVIDGYTEPGASQATGTTAATLMIELDGSQAGSSANGLAVSAGGCTVRGLVINRFALNGIDIQTNGTNVIQGNHIGTDVAGTVDLGNSNHGIYIYFAAGNTVGGTSAATRNVISGNDSTAVRIIGYFASETVVQGNYLGTDANGTAELGNAADGIYIWGAHSTTIGGMISGAHNVISANERHGVLIHGNGATGTLIQGNYIGIDVTGIQKLGNGGDGILILGAPNSTIGGTTSNARNVISDNGGYGIVIASSNAINNLVQGNYIGTDFTGTADFGNNTSGIYISQAPFNTIGGTIEGARNIISGNGQDGIVLEGTTGTQVQGNYVGTDFTGTVAVSNGRDGVYLYVADGNTVGGTTTGARNVISGNHDNGLKLVGNQNIVQGNFVGTDVTGTIDLSNFGYGVFVHWHNNTIGGSASGARNLVSGNNVGGILIDYDSEGNVVQGNYIGTDVTSIGDLGNGGPGVIINEYNLIATNHTIGGPLEGESNVIAFNDGEGVDVRGGLGNRILSNSIYGNDQLGIDLYAASDPPNGVTANDSCDMDIGANYLQNYPVLTSVITDGASCTTIDGMLNSTPNMIFRLEFFSSAAMDPTHYGEGELFLGSTNVTTDENGDVFFSEVFPTVVTDGGFLSATATDPDNNTSEFSHVLFLMDMMLSGEVIATELVLNWTEILVAAEYWVYGVSNIPYFEPGLLSPYEHRIAVVPSGTTMWSSTNGIGDPNNNWSYRVVAVDASEWVLCLSNRFGEQDFLADIP
jgi:titin